MTNNRPDRSRKKAERRGHFAEYVATLYLILKGYRVLALRYKTPLGEIDIVARKGDVAVFVEVKSRRDPRAAIDAVTPPAQRRIRAASDLWLARRADASELSQRYDIIAVLPRTLPRHFIDAF